MKIFIFTTLLLSPIAIKAAYSSQESNSFLVELTAFSVIAVIIFIFNFIYTKGWKNFNFKKEKTENQKIDFFKKNIENSQLLIEEYSLYPKFPLRAGEIGQIFINDKSKEVKIEFVKTSTKEIQEGGSSYQAPTCHTGYLLCENAAVKIWKNKYGDAAMLKGNANDPETLSTLDNDFILEKSENMLSLKISNNLNGIKIICEKISVQDYKEIDVDNMDDHRDIVNGTSYGKFFSINYEK